MCSRVAVGLLILALSTNLVLSCLNSCLCITQYEGVIVHCNGTGLTDIPRNIPNDAYAIHMDKNPITIIENGTFQNMTSLETLNLYWCNISTIETNAFINLPKLQYLYLSNNRITSLHQATFKELSALIKLDLRNNRITTLQNGIFQDNQALQDLSLRGNNLTFVKNDTFVHNINLQWLFLDLECDCNVAFWSWVNMVKSKGTLYEVIRCLDRNYIYLSSLQASDFNNCDDKSCNPDYCSNGGSCSQDSYGYLECSCVGNWTGATCTGINHVEYTGNFPFSDFLKFSRKVSKKEQEDTQESIKKNLRQKEVTKRKSPKKKLTHQRNQLLRNT